MSKKTEFRSLYDNIRGYSRLVLTLLLVSLLYACCPPTTVRGPTFEWAPHRSVVPLRVQSGHVIGSAVTVKCTRHTSFALTAEHLTRIPLYASQPTPDGRLPRVVVLKRQEKGDLALVSWPGMCIRESRIRNTDPVVGEKLIIIGAPYGAVGFHTSGVVMKSELKNGWRRLCTDGTVLPGNSGGGMFDNRGFLLGIVSFRYKPFRKIAGCAVHTSHLREFYKAIP